MSLLIRAAVLGGIAYFITRSLRNASGERRMTTHRDRTAPVGELHPGENIWPTSESQQPSSATAGPGA
jgi:hypothetical protein